MTRWVARSAKFTGCGINYRLLTLIMLLPALMLLMRLCRVLMKRILRCTQLSVAKTKNVRNETVFNWQWLPYDCISMKGGSV